MGGTLMISINQKLKGCFVQVKPKRFHSQKLLMEEAQIVLDVEATPLSESMQRKLDRGITKEANNFTIFRIPHNISQSKKNLFEPSVISIGPFHRGKKSLQTLEEQKWRFLQDFLSRGDHISLDLCISEMKLLEERTRRCYSETVDLGSNAFVEMMLLDGCFVLEYFLKWLHQGQDSNSIAESNSIGRSNSIAELNSIVEVGWNCDFIDCDLLLLENQIPFFIVEKLYEIGLKQEVRDDFVIHIVGILAEGLTNDYIDSIIAHPPAEIHHLVHLYYHCFVPNPEKTVVFSSKSFIITRMLRANRIIKGLLHQFCSRPVPQRRSPHSTSRSSSVALSVSTQNISSMVIPCATELKQKGLKFATKCNPKHMLDISLEYGVLQIPRLEITDHTKPIFANLLAFEHSKYGKDNSPFGRFLSFLDNLVNTPNDVIILQDCGIIENWLGSEEELAHFLGQVTEGNALSSDHYLEELYIEVNRYIGSSWNKQRAVLVRDYFSSPWAAISLVAAVILLVLTCLQSFYAVYAYKYPPSS